MTPWRKVSDGMPAELERKLLWFAYKGDQRLVGTFSLKKCGTPIFRPPKHENPVWYADCVPEHPEKGGEE